MEFAKRVLVALKNELLNCNEVVIASEGITFNTLKVRLDDFDIGGTLVLDPYVQNSRRRPIMNRFRPTKELQSRRRSSNHAGRSTRGGRVTRVGRRSNTFRTNSEQYSKNMLID
ncbi:conserved hypothetical protein [Ricinus communis]|uniref:Uncharacterized protein n=1 Tax=Ricinus communis TaxID=3988 RepID=B9RBI8_RICCO|nr:conserved hypothetical protein [Ricinus communis]